jgi:hypothetical protein
MIVGCYTVHLYCDSETHEGYLSEFGYSVKTPDGYKRVPHEFAGKNEAECLRQARDMGWRITRDRQTFCPFCKSATVQTKV